MKYKVLILDSMSDIAHKTFNDNNINVDIKTGLSEDQILEIINEYEAVVVRSATKVTKKIIESAKQLKIIGRAGAGVDNIDIQAAKKNNIIVMNTPGANSNATAEHAFALIMSLKRNIIFANSSTHEGKWEKKNLKGSELSNNTIGLIGFGNVSIRLIKLLEGFNLNIQTYSKSFSSRQNEFPKVKNVDLESLIQSSDVISFHCKAIKNNEPLLKMNHLKKMKKNCIIINTARGNLINEEDLNEALNKKIISGAAIDVYSNEPAKENVLFNNPRAILTPHIAASTNEAQITVAKMIAEQISNYLISGTIVNNI